MYIALASVHALVLCGLQFVACVRGQWTGKRRRRTPARARCGGRGEAEEEGILQFRRKSSRLFSELIELFKQRVWDSSHTAICCNEATYVHLLLLS